MSGARPSGRASKHSDASKIKIIYVALTYARASDTTKEMVTALHHVNVTVPSKEEEATKNFYGTLLGLKQIPKPAASRQSGAWYQIGDNQLHLSVEDGAQPSLSSRHICFSVSDLAAAQSGFREAGVEIIPDPRPVPGTQRFYVRDPGGNQLEIVQQT